MTRIPNPLFKGNFLYIQNQTVHDSKKLSLPRICPHFGKWWIINLLSHSTNRVMHWDKPWCHAREVSRQHTKRVNRIGGVNRHPSVKSVMWWEAHCIKQEARSDFYTSVSLTSILISKQQSATLQTDKIIAQCITRSSPVPYSTNCKVYITHKTFHGYRQHSHSMRLIPQIWNCAF